MLFHTSFQPRNVSALTSLKILYIDHSKELSFIHGLTRLTSLQIFRCHNFTHLSGLEKLTQLTSLHLEECTNLTQLPGLENLTQLTSLRLKECPKLVELPALDRLTQLTKLSLFACRSLAQLSGLDNLIQLTSLDLSFSGIRELPAGIRNMKFLKNLYLDYMNLLDLPDWLPEITEIFSLGWLPPEKTKTKAYVSLYHTVVESIPDMSIFEQPYEMVVKWFEDRKRGRTQTLNEIKVVFLGDGEAGKSHTIARLMNDGGAPVDYVDTATPGIVIRHRNYTLDDRSFRVHYWDFGGQEIMHSMHRIFLTGRTMYVVLINARDDTQSDRAQYWLHNIQSFAPNAPVLLVLNKIDQNPKASIDERTLRARYSGLTQTVRLSALKFGQEEFNRAFTDVLLSEIRNTGYLDAQWPGSWIRVKEQLENMEPHYILGSQYKAICRECQVDDLQTELLHWFNDLGVSFCFCDKEDYTLKKHVILRPDWITNGLYIILFNECPGADNGQIPHSAIYELLERASYDDTILCTLPEASYDKPGEVEYVLCIMRKFQLSLDCADGTEFIPMLCRQDAAVDIHEYEQDAGLLEFRMDFDYLPDNLLHRLMVERYGELDKASAWRKGAKFEIPDLGCSAVVMIDGKQLRFFIRHTDPLHRPNTYLTMLKANVDRIVARIGLEKPTCMIVYKYNGGTELFEYDTLKTMMACGAHQTFSMLRKALIPVPEILYHAAPDILEDETKLLTEIKRSCRSIQDEPNFRLIRKADGHGYKNGPGMEDFRNRRVRDDLLRMGFKLADQSQRGSSGTGRSIGELDLLVLDEQGEPWTIIEALRTSDEKKTGWREHLDKLLNKYNARGLPRLYLLTYVDADPAAFDGIWDSYRRYIQTYSPRPFVYTVGSFTDLSDAGSPQYIKTAKCQYACGGMSTTVYHIFAQIPTRNE